MPQQCQSCGATIKKSTARFCSVCGMALDVTGGDGAAQDSEPAAAPRPRLVIQRAGHSPREEALAEPTSTLGRRADNDIVLPLNYVSGHHGRFTHREGEWIYEDLRSTNGTYLNGVPVERAALQEGDILRIGDPQGNSISLKFYVGEASQVADAVPDTIQMGTTTLNKDVVLIGRDPDVDIPLVAPVVSWHHAQVLQTEGGHQLLDLGSTNGTFVNGQRIQGAHPLHKGDVVQIGPFKLVYEATGELAQYTPSGGVRLDGVNLTWSVETGSGPRRILHDISLSVQPREFVTLVGPSGAGKSSLLKALNGVVHADGAVLLNGDDLYEHFDLYRTMIGYVPQDDILHKDLTVARALHYAAELRLPPDTTPEEREQRVHEVLAQVEMVGYEQQFIRDLSGGQRKRISIAVELLADPKLFFLDEPTSGLDPGLEKKMMFTLRKLADGGRTIILVTHATANINQCDHVCFLSQGRLVYFGPPSEAKTFFEVASDDFADIYAALDAEDLGSTVQRAESWAGRLRGSPYYEQYVVNRQQGLAESTASQGREAAPVTGPRVNDLRQFGILTRRYLDLVLRDRLLRLILVGVMPLVGVLLMLIAEPQALVGHTPAWIADDLAAQLTSGVSSATYLIVNKTQTLLFMFALAAVLLGLFAAIFEIVKESSIYARERMVGLRRLPYLGSKMVVLGGAAVVQVVLLLLVIGLRVRLKVPGGGVLLPLAMVEVYVTLLLAALAAMALGLFISALVPSVNTGIYVLLPVLFFQIIFAGAIFDLDGAAQALSYFTLTRWAMEGVGASANIERVNALSQTQVQPDPVTEVVSVSVAQPAEGWTPITVITETRRCLVQTPLGEREEELPVVVEVRENPPDMVLGDVARSVTVQPDPLTIQTPRTFNLNFARTPGHLLGVWGVLLGNAVVFTMLTLVVLRREEPR